jgi:hypothetical protein
MPRWLHRFYVRVREFLHLPKYRHGRYDNFEVLAYFTDGSNVRWRGRPWGITWEDFKELLQEASYIMTNMQGEFDIFR